MEYSVLRLVTLLKSWMNHELLLSRLKDEPHIILHDALSPSPDPVENIREKGADVALVEGNPQDRLRNSLIQRLVQGVPYCRLLMLSPDGHPESVEAAFESGATGFITYHANFRELLHAIHEVHENKRYCEPGLCGDQSSVSVEEAPSVPPAEPEASRYRVSNRDRQILHLTAKGLTSREIGSELQISHRTVEGHWQSLRERFGAPNKAALVHRAHQSGILSPTA